MFQQQKKYSNRFEFFFVAEKFFGEKYCETKIYSKKVRKKERVPTFATYIFRPMKID